jgi:hypothetical protein
MDLTFVSGKTKKTKKHLLAMGVESFRYHDHDTSVTKRKQQREN